MPGNRRRRDRPAPSSSKSCQLTAGCRRYLNDQKNHQRLQGWRPENRPKIGNPTAAPDPPIRDPKTPSKTLGSEAGKQAESWQVIGLPGPPQKTRKEPKGAWPKKPARLPAASPGSGHRQKDHRRRTRQGPKKPARKQPAFQETRNAEKTK